MFRKFSKNLQRTENVTACYFCAAQQDMSTMVPFTELKRGNDQDDKTAHREITAYIELISRDMTYD